MDSSGATKVAEVDTARFGVVAIVAIAIAIVVTWKVAIYYTDNERTKTMYASALTRIADLEKEVARCSGTPVPGWRPGNPIGRPAGATPEPTPVGSEPK